MKNSRQKTLFETSTNNLKEMRKFQLDEVNALLEKLDKLIERTKHQQAITMLLRDSILKCDPTAEILVKGS